MRLAGDCVRHPELTASEPIFWEAPHGEAPVTHVLQLVGDCLATKKQLQPMQPLCDQKLHFSVADQPATGRRQQSLKSATDWRLVGDWLQTDWKWVAIGRQTAWRPVGDHQKPLYDRFGRREVSLAANKISLRPNRPCNLLQPVDDHLATALQAPCEHPIFWSQEGCRPVASYVWPGLKRTRGRPHATFHDALKMDTGLNSAFEIRILMEGRDEWRAAIRDPGVGVGLSRIKAKISIISSIDKISDSLNNHWVWYIV